MWFLYIIVAILFIAFAICLLPAEINLSFDNSLVFKAKIYGITLYSSNKDKKKSSHKKNKQTSTDKNQKKDNKNELSDTISLIKYLFNIALRFLKTLNGYYKNHHQIDEFSFKFTFGFDDAALTGIFSGGVYAIFYPLDYYVNQNYKIKKHSISIIPDFNNSVFEIQFTLKFKIKLFSLIKFLAKEAIDYLKYKKEKEGKQNGRTPN